MGKPKPAPTTTSNDAGNDGDPTPGGILGAKVPELDNPKWRWFYTQQHGDNTTYESR